MRRVAKEYWRAFYDSHVLRRTAIWLIQIAIFYCSVRLSALVRFDFSVPAKDLKPVLLAIPIWIVLKTITFRVFGLLRGWWLYLSVSDVVWLALGNTVASVLCYVSIVWLKYAVLPRSIYFIDALICFVLTGGVRIGVRMLRERNLTKMPADAAKNAIIYGAGEAGLMLVREIRRNPKLPYRVKGFVDDQPSKKGLRICGVPVLGGGDRIEAIVSRHNVEMVLIAIPSATGAQMTQILERCHSAGVECRTVPSLAEMISGRALSGQIREVAVEDLLGRSPVVLAEDQIRGSIGGKVILVTGAGGSIGSELCRQIARFSPAAIVGFESAESALFAIEREMQELHPQVPFYPEIGNIQNTMRLDEVLSGIGPRGFITPQPTSMCR